MFEYDEDAERAAKILDEYNFVEDLSLCYDAGKRDPDSIMTYLHVNYKELETVLDYLTESEFMDYLCERYPVRFEEAVDNAIEAIRKADMLIVGGTSLQVYLAAGFVYQFRGEHLVVINKEEISITLNPDQDLFIRESLGKVFEKIKVQ